MRFRLSLLALLLATGVAHGQAVQQSGTVTARHIPYWASNGVISDGGTSADSPISSIGVTNEGGAGFCVGSQRQSAAGRNLLCFSAATAASAKISLQNYGIAAAQNLDFVINGTTVTLPTGGGTFVLANPPFTVGHASCWLNTAGVLVDCGAGLVAGTQNGLAYYTAAGFIGGTAAGTNGQIPVATTSAAPAFKTLSGDIGSVSSAGAVTLQSVNGIPFASTYTAHGTLVAQGTGQWTASVTNNVGYCWLSQGSNADPIWAPCASGSGSAGGSTTQVQFNSSSSLAGSANMTWVSPTLTLGVAGTTTGQLGLASSTATGTVTLQSPGVSGTYNFNFPTGAGSLGQPLLSGGGGATPSTFGTLSTAGGGTGCTTPSGTCLDNITAFSSTGYIKRTGSGTYALSSPIPVSDGGTNLASGTSGGILGFTASGTIASSALLAANGFVIGGGAGATPTALAACTNGQIPVGVTSSAPACQTLSGDITTVSSAGLVTIANSAITNAKLANAAAFTFKGNATGSSAAPTDFTPASLTQKASPAAGDYLVIADNAAAGALKFATVSSIASAGSVSSIAGNTGAFTLTLPITNATNAILLNATIFPQGRITLTTSVPVLTSTVSAATSVFYTPYIGNLVPIYDGTNVIPTAVTELTITLGSNWAANSNWDVFIASDSGTIRACTGPAWTSDTARGSGAGTTELSRTSGLILNNVTVTCRYNNTTTFSVAASRGTYVGSFRTGSAGQTNWVYGAVASGGTAGLFGVWNMYNRVTVLSFTGDSTDSWATPFGTIRAANGSATMRCSFISGITEDAFEAAYNAYGTAGVSGNFSAGIGYDTTSAYSIGQVGFSNNPTNIGQISGSYGTTALGFHFLSANEFGANSNPTFYGDGGAPTTAQNSLSCRMRM